MGLQYCIQYAIRINDIPLFIQCPSVCVICIRHKMPYMAHTPSPMIYYTETVGNTKISTSKAIRTTIKEAYELRQEINVIGGTSMNARLKQQRHN